MLHLKRWTGVSAGWVLSSEIGCFGEPTASDRTEGNNALTRKREQGAAPRSRRPLTLTAEQRPGLSSDK